MHYSRADVCGKDGGPVARLGYLVLDHLKSSEGKQWTGKSAHISHTLFTREPHGSVRDVCCDIDRTLKRFWEVKNCGLQIHD